MTSPGGVAPEGSWQWGSDFGQNVPSSKNGLMNVLRGQQLAPWERGKSAFKFGDRSLSQKMDDLDTLQSKTQELEGVIGYAHGYINGGWSTDIGMAKRNVDREVGRTVGVTRASGAYYLNSKGLWVADAQLTVDPSGVFVSDNLELQIRVYDNFGVIHWVSANVQKTGERMTMTLHVPFTVPRAGFFVEFWANVAGARSVPGGSRFTGLSVEKRSTETE